MSVSARKMTLDEALALGAGSWDKWDCETAVFDWEYTSEETCYILEGDIIITWSAGSLHASAGMMITFSEGLTCTWDVRKPISKLYTFEPVIVER